MVAVPPLGLRPACRKATFVTATKAADDPLVFSRSRLKQTKPNVRFLIDYAASLGNFGKVG